MTSVFCDYQTFNVSLPYSYPDMQNFWYIPRLPHIHGHDPQALIKDAFLCM